jgi:hypothetical protein
MPQAIILYPTNHLEGATVTVSGAAAGFPKERLSDRDAVLPWKDTGTAGNRVAEAVRGASDPLIPVDTMILPAGHNLAGVTVRGDSSPDGTGPSWTNRVSFVPPSAAAVKASFGSLTLRGWRLFVATPPNAIELGELWFSSAVALPRPPLFEQLQHGVQGHVVDHESRGGFVWSAQLGDPRWTASYGFRGLSDADKATLDQAFRDTGGGAKHLFLDDADGVLRWVEWLDRALVFEPTTVGKWRVTLHFREVL